MEKSSNKLVDLSVAFAFEILNLVKYLKSHYLLVVNKVIQDFSSEINITTTP